MSIMIKTNPLVRFSLFLNWQSFAGIITIFAKKRKEHDNRQAHAPSSKRKIEELKLTEVTAITPGNEANQCKMKRASIRKRSEKSQREEVTVVEAAHTEANFATIRFVYLHI
ncbi:hypothetical protein BC936DRAFT_142918, partial [Jimgerdemannia flammicorona]